MSKHTTTQTTVPAATAGPKTNHRGRRKPGRGNTTKAGDRRPNNPNAAASANRVEWLAPHVEKALGLIDLGGRDIERHRKALVEAGHGEAIATFETNAAIVQAASLDGATNAQIDALKAAVDGLFDARRTLRAAMPAREAKPNRAPKPAREDRFDARVEALKGQAAKAAEVATRDLAKVAGKAADAWLASLVAAGFDLVEATGIVEAETDLLQQQVAWATDFAAATAVELKEAGYTSRLLDQAKATVDVMFTRHREWINPGTPSRA